MLAYESSRGKPVQIIGIDHWGFFQKVTPDLKGYHAKKSQILNFTFPQNEFFTSNADFFEKYDLFINENGLNIPGKTSSGIGFMQEDPHHYWALSNILRSQKPLFVGDKISIGGELYYIHHCHGVYHQTLGFFKIALEYSPTLDFRIKSPQNSENLFFKKIIALIDGLQEATSTLIQGATSPNGLVTFPAKASFDQKLHQLKKELQDARF